MKGPLAEEMDQMARWFSRVYPLWNLTVHYKWRGGKVREHQYSLVISHHGKQRVLPFNVPEAWFEDPSMEQELRDAVLNRLQLKTIQEVG